MADPSSLNPNDGPTRQEELWRGFGLGWVWWWLIGSTFGISSSTPVSWPAWLRAGMGVVVVDRIHIRDLLVHAIIGINARERVEPQDVLVNAVLYVDTRSAGESDDMNDSVNYSTVTKAMYRHIEESQPGLVEKLVADLARVCFEVDERIEEVQITAEKPGAVTFTRSVGVTIHRTREEVLGR